MQEGKSVYRCGICDGQFLLTVTVEDGRVFTRLDDTESGEEYVLHLVGDACGAFTARVRAEYTAAIEEMFRACFVRGGGVELQGLLRYAEAYYGDRPEFLWEKYPDTGVLRRGDTGKWDCVFLPAPKKALFGGGEGNLPVADFRIASEKIPAIFDGVGIFPAYHMNKKHWVSVMLDGSVSEKRMREFLDASYLLACK